MNEAYYQGGRGARVTGNEPWPGGKDHIHLDIWNQSTTFLLSAAPPFLSSIIISHSFTQHAYLKAWLLWSYRAYLWGQQGLLHWLCSAPLQGTGVSQCSHLIRSDNPDRIKVMAELNSNYWIWQTFRCYLPVTVGGKIINKMGGGEN